MDSLRCLANGPLARYTPAEQAQAFIWYHLRRHPRARHVHVRTIQRYFRKAGRRAPDTDTIRQALDGDRQFPPGPKPNTYAFPREFWGWHNDTFGECFTKAGRFEKIAMAAEAKADRQPLVFWLGTAGSVCSIVAIPLGIALWYWPR